MAEKCKIILFMIIVNIPDLEKPNLSQSNDFLQNEYFFSPSFGLWADSVIQRGSSRCYNFWVCWYAQRHLVMVCVPVEGDPPVIAHYYLPAPTSNYLAGRRVFPE